MEAGILKTSIEAKDPFASSPPGHSLTEDISKWAWGRPPQDVDPEVVIQKAINSLKQPMVKEEMMKLLIVGVSVEVMVEGYILQGFQDGRFNPDVGLLIKGPLSLYIANMAEEEGIPYRLFENDDVLEKGEMDDETFFRMMKDNNPQMFSYIRENVNASIRAGNTPQEPNFMTMEREKEE